MVFDFNQTELVLMSVSEHMELMEMESNQEAIVYMATVWLIW